VILSGKRSLLDEPSPRAAASEADETAALRRELVRIVVALYGVRRDTPAPGTLRDHLTAAATMR
jgi:hypothetical protein